MGTPNPVLLSTLNGNLGGSFNVVYSNTIPLGSTKTLTHEITKSYKQVFIILLVFNGSNTTHATINTSNIIKQLIINNSTALSGGSARIGLAIAKLENVETSNSISYTVFGDYCRIIELGY